MSKKGSVSNISSVERRKHWRDRRSGDDRRTLERLHLEVYDCRGGLPRRLSDVSGELADGEIWWNKDLIQYE